MGGGCRWRHGKTPNRGWGIEQRVGISDANVDVDVEDGRDWGAEQWSGSACDSEWRQAKASEVDASEYGFDRKFYYVSLRNGTVATVWECKCMYGECKCALPNEGAPDR